MKRDVDPLVNPESLIDEAMGLYDGGGLQRGESTGWPALDEFYTVATGQWTAVTGIPGSGKSEWLDAVIMNLWKTRKWEFAIYSPENYPTSTHLIKFAEKDTGKPFGAGPTTRMTKNEFFNSALDIANDIYWMEPSLKTPDRLIHTALSAKNPDKQLGIVLDPWNTLEHQRGSMNETDYVSFILTEVTKLARSANAHIWLVVHPTKMYRDKDGKRGVPSPYDISGSAHWYNKADNIVTVHRDQADDTQNVDIHIQKVRFKHIGRPGLVTLKYNKINGRYFEGPSQVIYDPVTRRPEKYMDPAAA